MTLSSGVAPALAILISLRALDFLLGHRFANQWNGNAIGVHEHRNWDAIGQSRARNCDDVVPVKSDESKLLPRGRPWHHARRAHVSSVWEDTRQAGRARAKSAFFACSNAARPGPG